MSTPCGRVCEANYDAPICRQCGALRGDKVEAAGVKPALERQPPSATGKGGP